MNSRGQAALEYLMTYGWALIVIAIVVGVLVFIVATPTGAVACNSSQPGKLNVVSNNLVSSTGLGSMVVTNLTGGSMTSVGIGASGVFKDSTFTVDSNTSALSSLTIGDHTLSISALNGITGSSGTYVFSYNDPAGLTQTATITCQNLDVS